MFFYNLGNFPAKMFQQANTDTPSQQASVKKVKCFQCSFYFQQMWVLISSHSQLHCNQIT